MARDRFRDDTLGAWSDQAAGFAVFALADSPELAALFVEPTRDERWAAARESFQRLDQVHRLGAVTEPLVERLSSLVG